MRAKEHAHAAIGILVNPHHGLDEVGPEPGGKVSYEETENRGKTPAENLESAKAAVLGTSSPNFRRRFSELIAPPSEPAPPGSANSFVAGDQGGEAAECDACEVQDQGDR